MSCRLREQTCLTSPSSLRRVISANSICSILNSTPAGTLTSFPSNTYSICLALLVQYQKIRQSKQRLHTLIAQENLNLCLKSLEDFRCKDGLASEMSRLGREYLNKSTEYSQEQHKNSSDSSKLGASQTRGYTLICFSIIFFTLRFNDVADLRPASHGPRPISLLSTRTLDNPEIAAQAMDDIFSKFMDMSAFSGTFNFEASRYIT